MVTCCTPSIGSRSCSSGGRHTPTTAEVIGVAMGMGAYEAIGVTMGMGSSEAHPSRLSMDGIYTALGALRLSFGNRFAFLQPLSDE